MPTLVPMDEKRRIATQPAKPNWIWGPLGVFRIEVYRTLTVGRIMTWLFMCLFPPTLIGIATWQIGSRGVGLSSEETYFGLVFLLFVLISQVMTVLGMVLWATPIVYSELEAQTWVYAVVRPGARRAVLVGKYFVAVLWTISSSTIALTLSVPISGIANPVATWGALVCVTVLGSCAYAALFATIGTVIQKRAMVIAFIYAFVVEAILSTLPAAINQFTVSYRLRAILFQLLDLKVASAREMSHLFDTTTSISMHVVYLGIFTACLSCLAVWRVQATQFIWQSEV